MSTHDPHPSLMVCIDLETTGLDEQTGLVLEVAARVVTNDLSPVDDGISLVVAQHARASSTFPVFPWRGRMNEYVTNMHAESGLTREVDQATLSIGEVDARIAAYVEAHAGEAPLLLVGNSITLDRNFLREHLPVTFAKLHHRSIDLTSVEQFLARQMGMTIDRVAPTTGHRAMDDVNACLATGRSISGAVALAMLQRGRADEERHQWGLEDARKACAAALAAKTPADRKLALAPIDTIRGLGWSWDELLDACADLASRDELKSLFASGNPTRRTSAEV